MLRRLLPPVLRIRPLPTRRHSEICLRRSMSASSSTAKASSATRMNTSTGLAGLPVHPKPREALLDVYRKTLAVVERMPAESAYRQAVERLSRERIAVVESHEDRADIERIIGRGQMEQLLVQAIDEQALAERMLEWRPWEPLADQPPSDDQWQYFDANANNDNTGATGQRS